MEPNIRIQFYLQIMYYVGLMGQVDLIRGSKLNNFRDKNQSQPSQIHARETHMNVEVIFRRFIWNA